MAGVGSEEGGKRKEGENRGWKEEERNKSAKPRKLGKEKAKRRSKEKGNS